MVPRNSVVGDGTIFFDFGTYFLLLSVHVNQGCRVVWHGTVLVGVT